MDELTIVMKSLNSLISSTRIGLLDRYGRDGVTASQHLEIKPSTAAGGLGLFTTKEILAGEEIFRIDEPQFYVSIQTKGAGSCDYCLYAPSSDMDKSGRIWNSEGEGLKLCHGCRKVAYCSKACQRRGWRHHHKYECELLQKEPVVELNNQMNLALRMLCLDASGQISTQTWTVISNLESQSDITRGEWDNLDDPSFEYIKRVSGSGRTIKEIKDLCSRIFLNCHTMAPAEDTQIGVFLHPLASSINHDCDANASYFCDSQSFRIRSIKDIPKGGEITVSYIPIREDYITRQIKTRKGYGFQCKCSRCEIESNSIVSKFESFPGALSAKTQISVIWDSFVSESRSDKNVEDIAHAISRIAKDAVPGMEWPEYLNPIPRAHLDLIDIYQYRGNHFEACRNALRAYFIHNPIVFGNALDVQKCYVHVLLVRTLVRMREYLESLEEPIPLLLQQLDKSEISKLLDKVQFMIIIHLNLVIVRARKVWGPDCSFTKALEELWIVRFDLPAGLLGEASALAGSATEIQETEEEIMEKFGVSKSERSFLLTATNE